MNNTTLIDKAIRSLYDISGIKATWKANNKASDGELLLDWNGHTLHTFLQVKKELRAYQIDQIDQVARQLYPLTVVAENIFPDIRKTLREKKIGYLDIAGNLYLPDPNHLIWIDGNKPVKEEKPTNNRAFTKAGLRTVFHLLQNEHMLDLPYRELARVTGGALGNITNVITGLKDAGFILSINAKKIRLQNKKALLERWMIAYHEILKPSLHIGSFEFWQEETFYKYPEMLKGEHTMVWGGEPAAEKLTKYLNPGVLTLYMQEKLRGEWLNKWGLVPKNNGRVRIYDKFWPGSNWDTQQLAPPLLVYTDLIMTHDPRCIETAHQLYDQYLRHEME